MASRHTQKHWVARDYLDPLDERPERRRRTVVRNGPQFVLRANEEREPRLVQGIRVGLSNRHHRSVRIVFGPRFS